MKGRHLLALVAASMAPETSGCGGCGEDPRDVDGGPDAGDPRDGGADSGGDGGGIGEESPPVYGIFQLYGDEYAEFRQAMGFSLPDYWDFVDEHVARLHVGFTRTNVLLVWGVVEPELGGGYVWDNEVKTDDVIRAVYAPADGKRMDVLLPIEPARGVGVPIELQDSFPRGHEAEYQQYVRAAVERYDGDGAEDADANVRVKHWQVMNEPFASLEEGLLTADDYAELVVLTARAVREADPEARVVLGDVGRFADQVIPALSGRVDFDAIDTHFWFPGPDDYVSPVAASIRRLLDDGGFDRAEIWMCEFGTWVNQPAGPDGAGFPAHTPADQARLLVKAMIGNRSAGVSRILWNNLVGWTDFGGNPLSIFNFMGLVSSGEASQDRAADVGHERVAYWSYQRLVAATESDVADLVGPRADLAAAPVAIVELRRRPDGRALFVAWSDGAETEVRLPWDAETARVTNLVSDAAGVFDERTVNASGAELALAVGRDPLLVEPPP